jgi:hypothetical protein
LCHLTRVSYGSARRLATILSRSLAHIRSKSSQPLCVTDSTSETIGDPFGRMVCRARRRSWSGTDRRSAPFNQTISNATGRRPRAAEEIVKLRSAGFVGSDHLAVNYRIVDVELGRQRAGERIEAGQEIPIARDQAVVARLDVIERAEAVVFDIEEPIGVIERLFTPSRRDRLHVWKGHSMGYAIASTIRQLVSLPSPIPPLTRCSRNEMFKF